MFKSLRKLNRAPAPPEKDTIFETVNQLVKDAYLIWERQATVANIHIDIRVGMTTIELPALEVKVLVVNSLLGEVFPDNQDIYIYRPGEWENHLHARAEELRDEEKEKQRIAMSPIDDKALWSDTPDHR